MSFHLSAEEARIESRDGRTYLHARLRREDGEWNDAEFDLDTVLGNDDGHFQWGGQNFTASARNITFDPKEGAAEQPILRAELQDCNQEWHARDVNLTEIVENINGHFEPKF
ncbi:Cyanovirin-N [Pseudoneurospora amorphoporcata]|uniref:Cyanovirin-N n=1 Tax=Pseudoneurospora amorphoporcata TaxID=241081 RepID=A0AAN6SFD3_9PEZI|nr:Cyanovirin-N [Pseudoneurospora amorphoporcata]